MLDTEDFGVNPKAPEFGRLGIVYVRHGKAMHGSAPKQRSVLSVFGWATECLDEWLTEIRPQLAKGTGQAVWPTERGGRVGGTRLDEHFGSVRQELVLSGDLTFHSLRRSASSTGRCNGPAMMVGSLPNQRPVEVPACQVTHSARKSVRKFV